MVWDEEGAGRKGFVEVWEYVEGSRLLFLYAQAVGSPDGNGTLWMIQG